MLPAHVKPQRLAVPAPDTFAGLLHLYLLVHSVNQAVAFESDVVVITTPWAASRGRRLRATMRVVMMPPVSCKKFSERFLQMRAFSTGLRSGPSYGGRSRMQEKSVFSCI